MQDLDQNKLIAGRYRLKQSLGKGSFGEVFHADDIQFQPPRSVALKLLHQQYLADEQIREDLRREASTLARFDHPNILRVIDFGVSPEVAFIVTELAGGGSLARRLRPDPTKPPVPLPLGEVAFILDQIADALDDAHAQGLVHRDIKPQNILIDRRGRPMLADFGLAAAVNSTSSSMMIDTSTSGTPLYMAPEQWQGRAGRASDIYALGAVVYQMVTGTPPFLGNQYELLGQHLNAPVPHLSERAPWLRYPPALDELMAAAMTKDPHYRLKPAKELAFRFRQALNQAQYYAGLETAAVPIVPRPNSPSGSLPPSGNLPPSGSLPNRNNMTPPPASGSLPPSGSGTYNTPPEGNPNLYQPTVNLSRPSSPPSPEAVNQPAINNNLNQPQQSPPFPTQAVAEQPLVSKPAEPARRKGGFPLIWLLAGLVLLAVVIVGGAFVLVGGSKPGNPTPEPSIATVTDTSSDTSPAATTDSSSTTEPATTSDPNTTSATDYTTAPNNTTAPVTTAAPTAPPLGTALATLNGHANFVLSVAFSPDSKTLATASEDTTIKLWDVAKKREKSLLSGHSKPVRSVAFSADGQYVVSGSADQNIKVWNVADSKEILNLTGHTGPVVGVAFSPDGKTIASASDDKTVRLWDVASGKSTHTLTGHTDYVTSVAFSPDGKTVASSSGDKTVKLWDVNTGNEIKTFKGHNDPVWSVAFSLDGKTLASGSFDHTIKLWDVATGTEKTTLAAYSKGVRQVAFSPDGKTVVSGSDDATVTVWDIASRQVKATLTGHTKEVYTVAISPNGKLIASGSLDNSARLWAL